MRLKRSLSEGGSNSSFLSQEEQDQTMSYTVLQSGSGNYLLSAQFFKQGVFDVVATYQEVCLKVCKKNSYTSFPLALFVIHA